LATSPSTLLLIGADSVDDVPAKPKPAASTNAIMIERIQSSLGLDLGLRTARSVWGFSLTKTVDKMHARYFADNNAAFMFCSGARITHDRLWPAADPCDMIRCFFYNAAHAPEQGNEGSASGPIGLAVQHTMLDVMRGLCACRLGLLVAIAVLTGSAGTATAQSPEHPRLHTNQAYVEDVTRATTLAIDDAMEVFAFVLAGLPDRVKVYPTENYYYFKFIHAGTAYAGNIRLDPLERDQGKVQFSYYPNLTEWRDKVEGDTYVLLDASRGVAVEQVERLVYRISYRNKSVVFALNDLSQVKPPAGALGPDEKFLGPIFDESAVRFFLVYNSKLKIFHFILDETVKVADDLTASARSDRILVGRRTGFAFYRDHRLERKIMIGAFEGNSRLNNYFDGPFDQLPENFIEGEDLRQAIVEADPSVKGQIGRLGHYSDGEGRYLIHPYMLYRRESDLLAIHKCATGKLRAPTYYRCFVSDAEGQDSPSGSPTPSQKKRGK
jgi:hypothetical protein